MSKTAYFRVESDKSCHDLDGKLVDTIKKLQDYLDTVPKEHQDLVKIEFLHDYYGGMEYDIYYRRPKTQAEIEAEEQRTRELKEKEVERQKAQAVKDAAAEKRLYKRLQKKYG